MNNQELRDIRECLENAIKENYSGTSRMCYLNDIKTIFNHLKNLKYKNNSLSKEIKELKHKVEQYEK